MFTVLLNHFSEYLVSIFLKLRYSFPRASNPVFSSQLNVCGWTLFQVIQDCLFLSHLDSPYL